MLVRTNVSYFSCLVLQCVLGKNIQRPAKLDRRLVRELKGLSDPEDPYDTVTGKTMCTYDFYEGSINCIFLYLYYLLLYYCKTFNSYFLPIF